MNILEISAKQMIGMMIRVFIAIINGMVPIVHAFLDDGGHLSSVNGVSYLRLLQDIICPGCNNLQLVLHFGGCMTALHHIAQMQL